MSYSVAEKPSLDVATSGKAGRFSARTSWALMMAMNLAVLVFFWNNEWPFGNFALSACVTGAIIACLAALTGRLLFATLLATAQVAIVAVAASVKLQLLAMLVHAYDLFFYFQSWSTVTYLARSFPLYTFGLFAAFLATALLAAIVYKLDAARVRRWQAALALVLFSLSAFAAHEGLGERRHMHLFFSNRFLSTYYSSWPETLQTIWQGQIFEAANQASGPAFGPLGTCQTPHKKPHIILIHQESVIPPSLFPTIDYDRSIDPFFASHDGKQHTLRVETYGGASWLTEFSVLAGVSTYSFGSMRQFVQTFMEGKLHETIPQVLADCGYRNVLFYPMSKNFVSNARFYESIGIKEIFDKTAQKAPSTHERDSFYYANALTEMERHFKASDKPLFTFIQTMSAHWPYYTTLFGGEDVKGGGPGTHPELHEYLRRLSLGAKDYRWLQDELKRRFPHESFVIVNYGDHQPSATRMLLGQQERTEVEDIKLSSEGPGFLSYYSITTQNWKAPALPDIAVLDVPYLGLALLEAARLPLSDAFQERQRLRLACKGRYHACSDDRAIPAFHRKLIDSGLMDSR